MYHPDETNDNFPWTGLFIVTALSFFVFSCVMKFLNGSFSPLFNKVAIVCSALGIISLLVSFLPDNTNNRNQNPGAAADN